MIYLDGTGGREDSVRPGGHVLGKAAALSPGSAWGPQAASPSTQASPERKIDVFEILCQIIALSREETKMCMSSRFVLRQQKGLSLFPV